LDVYDARVCTVVEPCVAASSPVLPCLGEACHGTPGVSPSLLAPASAVFSGAGNEAPPGVKPVVKAKKKPKAKPKPKRRVKRRRKGRGAAATGGHIKRGRR